MRLPKFRSRRALALVPRIPGPDSSAAAARALLSPVPAPRRAGFRGNTAMCSLASGAAGGYPRPLSTLLAQRVGRRARETPPALPGCGAGRWGLAGRVGEAPARAAGERGGGQRTPPPCSSCAWLALVPVRGRADRLRVLGGRGAVEDEDDLPELSDSGDEAAWEDEDDTELPHDKQQTPCLFCDRFVHLSAKRHP